MSQPRVLCVMPAAGRQAMVDRAVRSFRVQTYPNCALAVLDNGPEPLAVLSGDGVHVVRLEREPNSKRPVGALRNLVNSLSSPNAMDAEIIAHWDSDDWSHPERLTDQVALLQDLAAPAVGYREMLFWVSAPIEFGNADILPTATMWHGEAWLYSQENPRIVLGTSLLYWRAVWEKQPFPDKDTGEDTEWTRRMKLESVSSLHEDGPRMIASIHGENTCSEVKIGAREWQRAAQWDKHCSRIMTRC